MLRSSPRSRNMYRLLLCASFLAPIAFFLYTTFLIPRPYYISTDDHEHDYYYNGRLFYSGQSNQVAIHHPGTPIQYLASLILLANGDDIAAVQRFFNLAYSLISLVTATSLAAFVYTLLKGYPIGISTLAVASIVAWPPFLTYMNYFGCKSFIVAIGLPTLTLFWSNLEDARRPNRPKLVLCGIGAGACLATQLTFVPLSIALCIASAVQIVMSARVDSRNWRSLPLLPMSAVLSFLIFTAPIFSRLPTVAVETFYRNDVRPARRAFGLVFAVLLKQDLPLAIVIIIATTVFIYSLTTYVRGHFIPSLREGIHFKGDKFDYLSGATFVIVMLLSLVYTMASSTQKLRLMLAGDVLTHVSPTALFLPFLILYCYRLSRMTGALSGFEPMRLQVLGIVASLVVVTWAAISNLDQRRELILRQRGRIALTIDRLEAVSRPGTRIAFWDGSQGNLLGEASFHFWGSYRWAKGYFDQTLLGQYPRYTHFRLREVDRIVRENRQEENAASVLKKREHNQRANSGSEMHSAAQTPWGSVVQPSDRKVGDGIVVVSERNEIRVSVIAFPEDEIGELKRTTLPELLSLIQSRFGTPMVWKESIEGIKWVLIAVPGFEDTGRK